MPDFINGLFEILAGVFVLRHAWATHKAKNSDGISVDAIWFFTAFGLWNIFYYSSLDQMVSFCAGLFVIFANLVWAIQFYKYRKPKFVIREESLRRTNGN